MSGQHSSDVITQTGGCDNGPLFNYNLHGHFFWYQHTGVYILLFLHAAAEKCGWLQCPHTVADSVGKTKQLGVRFAPSRRAFNPQRQLIQKVCCHCKTCFLSTCSRARSGQIPTASQGKTTSLIITGFEVNESIISRFGPYGTKHRTTHPIPN